MAVMVISLVSPGISAYAEEEEETSEVYWPKGPSVESKSAIIMEANTGTILYEKNIHDQHYPASITKILTTLLAVENCDLSDTVVFSYDAVYKTEGTLIARDVDEEMSLEDTLYAVMLGSANECAYATAEHVAEKFGGDYNTFIDMMNERAKEIGCVDSHFANPHGLPDKDHYTSAYDMALIARTAIQNEKFKTICGTKKYVIPTTNKHDEVLYIVNHNAMLNYYKTGIYVYEYCIGGKTGYTTVANHTLVTYAEKDGMLLICVVMDTGYDAQYRDTRKLFDYYFDNYDMYRVADYESDYDFESIAENIVFSNAEPYMEIDNEAMVILPKTAEFDDVTKKLELSSEEEDVVATIKYSYGEKDIGTADIVLTNGTVEAFEFGNAAAEKEMAEGDTVIELNWVKILLIVLLIILLIGLAFLIRYLYINQNIIRYQIRMRKRKKKEGISFSGKRIRRKRLKKRKDLYKKKVKNREN